VVRRSQADNDQTELPACRGGTASLVLKGFLLTGTIVLCVWAGTLRAGRRRFTRSTVYEWKDSLRAATVISGNEPRFAGSPLIMRR